MIIKLIIRLYVLCQNWARLSQNIIQESGHLVGLVYAIGEEKQ